MMSKVGDAMSLLSLDPGSRGGGRAPRNRTVYLDASEEHEYRQRLLHITQPMTGTECENRTANGDLLEVVEWLPEAFADLLFLDPPYNLTKKFESTQFRKRAQVEYSRWFESWFIRLLRTLKPHSSIYVCADWQTSAAVYPVLDANTVIRNRITWEREKGRGTSRNWKNCLEDIWFCTLSKRHKFNANQVMRRRRVIAPYTDENGQPKDWQNTREGRFRLTYPSNLWTDLTVPFWSMPENTDHPTQKPEKLLAKVILASSDAGDMVFDPFLGSGTTSVVAKKLGRRYFGIEIDTAYCCLAEKRLRMTREGAAIQGYEDGAFEDRNCNHRRKRIVVTQSEALFEESDGEAKART